MTSPPPGDETAPPVVPPARGRWWRLRAARTWCGDVNRNYGEALLATAIMQMLGLALALTTPLEILALPILPYWVGAGMILTRRAAQPGSLDVAFIQWGYLWLLGVFVPLHMMADDHYQLWLHYRAWLQSH